MLSRLHTAALVGVDAVPVDVEVDVAQGLPGFYLVGLANSAVREGAVRVRAAISSSDYKLGPMRVTVNLAPADLPKHGAAFDVPIALASLASRRLITLVRTDVLWVGELSLDGSVRPIRGVLCFAEQARRQGLTAIAVPKENVCEAALIDGLEVYGIGSLRDAVSLAQGDLPMSPGASCMTTEVKRPATPDFSDVAGHAEARHAVEVSAAGGHNLMLIGPPGSGKTMLARRIAGILPPLTTTEALETTKVHSVAGLLRQGLLVAQRPFRAPHHTTSSAGLVGGGSHPRPGEVSLAHNGVMFLDELPEFGRAALAALRQPLEDRQVTIVRSQRAVCFPARFMLVAAMNPCPCGFRGSQLRTCICSDAGAARYRGRISGPLLDRFDIFVNVKAPSTDKVLRRADGECSREIATRVARARAVQARRYEREDLNNNAQLTTRLLHKYVPLKRATRTLLVTYAKNYHLSARALHRCCRVARTLADLDAAEEVSEEHVSLALSMQRARWLA